MNGNGTPQSETRHGFDGPCTPLTRREIADWLDQRGIKWAGAKAGAKAPKTTRPKEADPAPWDVHFDEGHMERGQQQWRDDRLADLYLWPGSINAGKAGAACGDLDRVECAEADAAWFREHVAPTPILDYPKPDGSGKRHVWVATDLRPGNGKIRDPNGDVIGEWRGLTAKGTLGAGIRLYPDELEALVDALGKGVGHPLTRAQWAATQREAPKARSVGGRKPRLRLRSFDVAAAWIREHAGDGRNDCAYRASLSLVNAGVITRECEGEAVGWLAGVLSTVRPQGERDVGEEAARQVARALRYVEEHPKKAGKGGRKRASLGIEGAVEEIGGQTLDSRLAEHGLRIRYNVRWMLDEISVADAPWEAVTDRHEANARLMCGGLQWQDRVWRTLWLNTLHHNTVDPFLEYLEGLPEWDGEPRVDAWAARAFRVRRGNRRFNGEMAWWIGIHVFLGCVKRTLDPGTKLDVTPVIEGEQGCGKSWHLASLFPLHVRGAFGDELNLGGRSKEMLEAIQGKALVEIAEMHGLTRAKIDGLKAFMTRTHDSGVRLAYRKNPEVAPRRCVYVGTVNNDGTGILPDDPTGNRRWAVLSVVGRGERPDVLMAERDQYWAEALHRVRGGEDPSFPEELAAEQAETNDLWRQQEPLEEQVADIEPAALHAVDTQHKPGLGIDDVMCEIELLGPKDKDGNPRRKPAEVGRGEFMRLSRALKARGWCKYKQRVDGAPVWRWYPPGTSPGTVRAARQAEALGE